MGKMKEVFIQQMNERATDMSDAEYQDWLKSQDDCCGGDCHCEGEPATQEDKESQYDAWWNSLTDEQKQQLYEEQESYEKERMEREIDIQDRMDIEDEMNHDLSFGK
jgi:hypothetical protein